MDASSERVQFTNTNHSRHHFHGIIVQPMQTYRWWCTKLYQNLTIFESQLNHQTMNNIKYLGIISTPCGNLHNIIHTITYFPHFLGPPTHVLLRMWFRVGRAPTHVLLRIISIQPLHKLHKCWCLVQEQPHKVWQVCCQSWWSNNSMVRGVHRLVMNRHNHVHGCSIV